MSSTAFLVGDNASVNKALADKICVPLLGCDSHRLNLAVRKYIKDQGYTEDISKVIALMQKLGTLKKSGHVRKSTDLDQRRKMTQDGLPCMKCYFQLLSFIVTSDKELAECLPSAAKNLKLEECLKVMKDFTSVSLKLQNEQFSKMESPTLFDALAAKYPGLEKYLGRSSIVHSPDFENALYKQQCQQALESHEEVVSVKAFSDVVTPISDSDLDSDFAYSILAKKIKNCRQHTRYEMGSSDIKCC